MLKRQGKANKFSQPIVILAIIGITLGMCVMILSNSVASGFQKEIREKVIGFGSHIQIESQFGNQSFESSPLISDPSFIDSILKNKKVRHVQNYAYKPAILQSKKKNIVNIDGKIIRDIEGVIFKGVDHEYDKGFFEQYMIEGQFPSYESGKTNDSIIISNYLAKRLRLTLHEKIAAFFIKDDGPKQRNLIVSGIYKTGLEDFDKQFGFIDLNQIRKLNGWGIKTHLILNENYENDIPVIEAKSFGGNGKYKYSWNNGPFIESNKFSLQNLNDTLIKVISSDFDAEYPLGNVKMRSIPDTAWIKIKILNKTETKFYCDKFIFNSLNDSVNSYKNNCIELETTHTNTGGSSRYYTGGIEILLKKYDDLFNASESISQIIGPVFRVSTISEKYQEIFNWLNMLDINVYIILGLMIAVAIINMTAALLVLILEKTQMIGILKSLGSNNWSIRKIFIYNGSYLIILGLITGNVLAIGIIILQNQFGIITLPQENYFVSVVPMHFPVLPFFLINLGAFFICMTALIFPSYLITKISPIKAIRLE